MSEKELHISGHALRIDGSISARDIASSDFTESYHNIASIIPFAKKIPNFKDEVFSKNIIIAEENFGFASSKELPALCLYKHGVKAIVAKSFFSGFYKNAFNVGLLCIYANTDYIEDDDELLIDLKLGFIQNRTKFLGIKFQPIKKYFYNLYLNKGLINSLLKEV